MNLPTEQECLDYFKEYVVPRNIYGHCLKVREVAVFLARELEKKGVKININLVNSISLLLDLFKVVSLKELTPNKFHSYDFSEEEITMWKLLREKYGHMYENEVAHLIFKEKYPELAIAIKNSGDSKVKNYSWEELIVHYADWRVFREKVVTLNERLDYLKENYPKEDGVWDNYSIKIKEQEQKLFKQLDFSSEELVMEMLKND